MPVNAEINGTMVQFERQPTDQDIDEVAGMIEQQDIFTVANLPETANVTPQAKAGLSKLINSPFTTGVGAFVEISRREESLGASALAQLTSSEPSLSKFVKDATQSITGEKILEFGDVLKASGVNPTVASIGGLVMSAFLPSTFLLAGGGKGITLGTKQARSIANAVSRSPNATKSKTVHLAANFLNKDPRRVQQLVDNIDVYNPRLADVRQSSVIAKKIQRGLSHLEKTAPDVLEPSKNIPFDIAGRAIGAFDDGFKNARIQHNQLIKQIIRENPKFNVSAKDLTTDMINTIKESQKALIRRTDVPKSEISAARGFFTELIEKLNRKKGVLKNVTTETRGPLGEVIKKTERVAVPQSRRFGLQELVNLREDLGKLAQGTFQEAGKPQTTNTTIDSLVKRLRSKVSRIIKDNFEEIAESDKQFVVLGDIDSSLRLRGIRDRGKMGNLLKGKDINPFKMEGITELDRVLPDGAKIVPSLEAFSQARTNSLASKLNSVGVKSGDQLKIEKAVRKFDLVEDPDEATKILRQLNLQLPDNLKFFEDLALHDMARAFSKAGSVFKAGATAGLVSSTLTGGVLGSSLGPVGAAVGATAGAAITIPPLFAGALKKGTGLARKVSATARQVAGSREGQQTGATLLRKLIQVANRPLQ